MASAADGPRLLSLKSSLEAHRLLVICIHTLLKTCHVQHQHYAQMCFTDTAG